MGVQGIGGLKHMVGAGDDLAGIIGNTDDIVSGNAVLHADEAPHWDALHTYFKINRINHEWAYSDEGACTNQAESFFSRLRRAEIGTHHHIAGPYLNAYAAEMAWREDNRRISNGEQFLAISASALAHPTSKSWRGYWQRNAVR